MARADGDRGLSALRAVHLIARREFIARVEGKIFSVGTAIAIALFAIYTVLQLTVLGHIDTTTTDHVGITADAVALKAPLQSAGKGLGITVQVSDVTDLRAAEHRVKSGGLDAIVTGSPTSPRVIVRSQLDSTVAQALTGIVHQAALNEELSSAGLDPAAVQAQANRASFHVVVLEPQQAGALQQPIIGALIAFLLYLFLGVYGGVIAQGVVSEKASRVVEVLLSTVRADQLLLGKVLGMGAAGLLQFAIIGAAALALTVPTHVLTLPTAAVGAVLAGVLWFVLGFLLYAMLLGAAASTASRVEEAAGASLPVTLVLLMAWLLAYAVFIPLITAASNGSTVPAGVETLGTVASLIPFFAPILMPIRMAAGDAPTWQVLIAVALTLLAIAATLWLGGRVYANSVLRFGARVKLRQALSRAQ